MSHNIDTDANCKEFGQLQTIFIRTLTRILSFLFRPKFKQGYRPTNSVNASSALLRPFE